MITLGMLPSKGLGGGGGGNDANTLLLIHCDGADASTTFTDSSASARTITTVGNAQVDTAQSVFGGASMKLDGSGDYITVPDSADWNFGTNNFTIDLRVRYNTFAPSASSTIFSQGSSSSNGMRLQAITSPAQALRFEVWGPGVGKFIDFLSAGGAVAIGTWYHIALVRNGNNWNIYKNGISIANLTDTDAISDYTGTLRFGNGAVIGTADEHNGWFDEIRVSNIARWTANFTPPTQAYS